MLATQAAVSAALVATLQPPTHGISFARFLDALVGGGVALVVNALVLPARPLDLMRRAAEPLLEELAGALEDVAIAVERRDRELAIASLERARGIDELERALRGGGRREPRDHALRPAAPQGARGGRELRGRSGADRPRRAQRARAGARDDPRALARRERPARDRRRAARARRGRARAGGRARGPGARRRGPRAGPAGGRPGHDGARGHRQPLRQRDRRARSARPPQTCSPPPG